MISNYYKEQYWSLAKVLLFNFCYAHFLAILLHSMSKINEENNWMLAKNVTGK
jgi:hypothetical protein